MGNQGTATDGIREGAEFVRSGGLGDVKEIHAWTNRPVWPQAPQIVARPKEVMSVPSHIDWDSFIGPAPMRPYNSCYTPFKWRGWWDYGTGALGDMACHTTNLAFMACELTAPHTVESVNTGPINSETYPSWATIHMHFPKTDKNGPIKFHWYEGKVGNNGKDNKGIKNLPPMELFHGEKPKNSGLLLVGTEGILYSPNDYGADWMVYRSGKWQKRSDVNLPEQFLPRNGRGDAGMKEELVKAIRENDPKIAMSNFDYAGNMTESILLGNVAMRAGGKFKWNAKKLSTNREDANMRISKEYRAQWGFSAV
jgi:predicted dehydrogenase